jgi:radical SAM protein with 4Fe4S-binding SPASM domain
MSPDDLDYPEACSVIDQLGAYGPLILVFSGGEPLWRADVFDLAERARSRNLRTALATNGTLIGPGMARRIQEAGFQRVSISLDGADARTHDSFRGHEGAFERAIDGLRCLRDLGLSTQINTTISRRNASQLPAIMDLAASLGVDAFHLFLLVPVGCGLTIADEESVNAEEAEAVLHWFYDRSLDSGMELKATCAPQYYRIARQRRAEARRRGEEVSKLSDDGMHAMTRGCLAGSGVCFISHKGEVFPCGYLPVSAGDLRRQSFKEIWESAEVFQTLRDTSNLEGKCGYCEFRNVCLGCRARAYGMTGNYLGEEPFCIYEPGNGPAQDQVTKAEER